MNSYYSKQGDTLDLICYRYYQQQADVVEQVFEANPGLSDLPVVLPLGTLINLPEMPVATAPQQTTLLW